MKVNSLDREIRQWRINDIMDKKVTFSLLISLLDIHDFFVSISGLSGKSQLCIISSFLFYLSVKIVIPMFCVILSSPPIRLFVSQYFFLLLSSKIPTTYFTFLHQLQYNGEVFNAIWREIA